MTDYFGIDRLRTGYRREQDRSTRHEHDTILGALNHDHFGGATKHWHKAGSAASEFGPEPAPEQFPARKMQIVEVRTCGRCGQPVIYWGGDFKHLAPACPSNATEER